MSVGPALEWLDDETFEIDGVTYLCDRFGLRRDQPQLCVAKGRTVIERYVTLLRSLAPRTIVEVGILEGGSTALLADLCQPDRLVALEWEDAPTAKLARFIEDRGLQDVVEVHGHVDQADTERVGKIVDDALAGRPLDLVIDDASHQLEPSRATFACLWPRLRPGGVYLLEDWSTGLGPLTAGQEGPPLIELVHDVLAMKGRDQREVAEVHVVAGWALMRRGDRSPDPAG